VSGVSLERPVVFGSASRIGDSGKADLASVARGGAVVAAAAAEADHYAAAAREFVDSFERSDLHSSRVGVPLPLPSGLAHCRA
jgi:hypothetical protein